MKCWRGLTSDKIRWIRNTYAYIFPIVYLCTQIYRDRFLKERDKIFKTVIVEE